MIDSLESDRGSESQISDRAAGAELSGRPANPRRAAFLTIAFGMVHALLLLAAFWLIKVRAPAITAPDSTIANYYTNSTNRHAVLIAGIYLIPFAAIAFIWFIVALRMWAVMSMERANVLFANIQLVSGVLYIGLILAAGASMSILAVDVDLSSDTVNPGLARQFPLYGKTLFLILAMRMAAMYVFSTTSLFRNSRLLPRWFLVFGALVGLALLLSASVSSWLILVFPIWLLILCTILLIEARRIPAGLTLESTSASPRPIIPPRKRSR
jgi:hypothetical protein